MCARSTAPASCRRRFRVSSSTQGSRWLSLMVSWTGAEDLVDQGDDLRRARKHEAQEVAHAKANGGTATAVEIEELVLHSGVLDEGNARIIARQPGGNAPALLAAVRSYPRPRAMPGLCGAGFLLRASTSKLPEAIFFRELRRRSLATEISFCKASASKPRAGSFLPRAATLELRDPGSRTSDGQCSFCKPRCRGFDGQIRGSRASNSKLRAGSFLPRAPTSEPRAAIAHPPGPASVRWTLPIGRARQDGRDAAPDGFCVRGDLPSIGRNDPLSVQMSRGMGAPQGSRRNWPALRSHGLP